MSLKMFSFHLDPDDIEKARQISVKEERPKAWIIRKIIEYGVNNWSQIKNSK